MVAPVASCQNHPQREAIGICVQCRVRICSECTTKVEGINYCVSCLAGLAVEGGRRASRSQADRGTATPYLEAAGWAAVLALCLWLTLEVLLPGA
ncbi:MAG TPA: B-box zinc finger protein [Longimicrobiales bacterium]|nr:B-box zinc finger protein [Longimicrobiales bacterium]